MDSTAIGIIAALGSAMSWAMGAILFKKVGEQLSSPAMTLVKSFISAVLLGVVLLIVGFERVNSNVLMWLAITGALGIAVGDTLFFSALKSLSPHTIIMLFTGGQVLTILLAVAFLHEKPTLKAWVGMALIVTGIFAVVRANVTSEGGKSRLKGIMLGALSVVCMSASTVIAKKPLESVSSMEATFIRMLAGGLTLLPLSAMNMRGASWWQPFRDFGLLRQFVLSVCVITFGGFWLSFVAIKHLNVSIASTLNSVEPLFVLPLAALFLKEKVTLPALAGSAMAVAGIALICLSQP